MRIMLMFFLTAASVAFCAEGARSRLDAKPEEVYPKLLESATKGNWGEIKELIEKIAPLVEEANGTVKGGVGMEEALSKKNKAEAESSVKKLIVGAMVSLLKAAPGAKEAAKRLEAVQQAYAEYVVLDPYVQSADFKLSQEIKSEFRKAYNFSKIDPESYRNSCSKIAKLLGQYLQNVK